MYFTGSGHFSILIFFDPSVAFDPLGHFYLLDVISSPGFWDHTLWIFLLLHFPVSFAGCPASPNLFMHKRLSQAQCLVFSPLFTPPPLVVSSSVMTLNVIYTMSYSWGHWGI